MRYACVVDGLGLDLLPRTVVGHGFAVTLECWHGNVLAASRGLVQKCAELTICLLESPCLQNQSAEVTVSGTSCGVWMFPVFTLLSKQQQLSSVPGLVVWMSKKKYRLESQDCIH
jgi:hypothetical protein